MTHDEAVKWLENIKQDIGQIRHEDLWHYEQAISEIQELLKEQGEREERICKSICDFIRGACSTDTDDDKDFVCYEIQKCFMKGR